MASKKHKPNKPVKRKKRAGKIIGVIAAVLIAAIIAASIGVSYWATDGYKMSVSDVSIVVAGGESIKAGTDAAESITLPLNQQVRIDVTAGLAKLGATTDYTVKVAPKSGVNFDFKLDGELVGFRGVGDVTSLFLTAKYDDYFIINTTVRPISAILQEYYDGQSVTDVPEDAGISAYFALTITAGDKTIIIDLTGVVVNKIDVTGVTLDNSTITF